MTTESPKGIHPEFQQHIDQQPYLVVLDGLQLTIDKDVFPPDMGRCAQNLARLAQTYPATTALDMGCGSGYLALMLKRSGIPEVWGADIHQPAVECAAKNVAQNPAVGPIQLLQSDLFSQFPAGVRFDLIIFNQPFGPGDGNSVCGCGADGGYQITKRFLTEAPRFLSPNGVILMAFSDREAAEHSPLRVADELGYPAATLLHAHYGNANNYIFEIRLPQRAR